MSRVPAAATTEIISADVTKCNLNVSASPEKAVSARRGTCHELLLSHGQDEKQDGNISEAEEIETKRTCIYKQAGEFH